MAEPISLSLIIFFKALGGAKLLAAAKGAFIVLKGKGGLILAKNALLAVKSYGVVDAVKMITFLLITIAATGALVGAAEHAYKALQAFAQGKIQEGFKYAAMAGWKGNAAASAIR